MTSTIVVERPGDAAPPAAHDIRRTRRRYGDTAFRLALQGCLVVAVAFLVSLLGYVLVRGWGRLDWALVANMPSGLASRADTSGLQSALFGTLWVIGLTALIALPVGIAGAIYLEEYADGSRWYNQFLELNIQNLAGVPSIVFGILGLGVIARGLGLGFTVITAALVLSLLVLPVVIISTREALRAVPPSIRAGSFALGATKWQTTWHQVLPAATGGTATGAILALSRAIGEAAPLILLGAVTFVRFNPDGLLSQYTVLPIQIFNLIKSPQAELQELAAAGIVLLLALLLAMNSAAIWIRNRAGRHR
jgi:phosphate transport system permease protein